MRIAGGTDEVMRNIIAKRVLGLPADIRVEGRAIQGDSDQGTLRQDTARQDEFGKMKTA